MSVRLDSHTACGSRRTSAAAAVANALNAVDLVAVVAASGGESDLMAALQKGLSGEPGTEVMNCAAPDECVCSTTARRTVVLCDARDAGCPAIDEQFEVRLRKLGPVLSARESGHGLKVVLVGSCALLEWVQQFPVLLPEDVRYRYILVH